MLNILLFPSRPSCKSSNLCGEICEAHFSQKPPKANLPGIDKPPFPQYTENMDRYEFTIVIEAEEEGGFSAHCPALPGCVSQGETYEETLENIRESVRGYVKSLLKEGGAVPCEERRERIEVSV